MFRTIVAATLLLSGGGQAPPADPLPPFQTLFYTSEGLRLEAYLFKPEGSGPFHSWFTTTGRAQPMRARNGLSSTSPDSCCRRGMPDRQAGRAERAPESGAPDSHSDVLRRRRERYPDRKHAGHLRGRSRQPGAGGGQDLSAVHAAECREGRRWRGSRDLRSRGRIDLRDDLLAFLRKYLGQG